MSNNTLSSYVVTLHYHESGLSDIQELNSAMLASGFTTSLNDTDGNPHELGTNSFGIVSPLDENALKEHVTSIGESILDQKPDVSVTSLDAFLKEEK